MSKPRHKHDCKACVYLGTLEDEDKGEFIDCYWCSQGKENCPNLCSVLGRYGSNGPEYASSHPFEAFSGKDEYLAIADRWYLFSLLQAIRMGLYKPTPIDTRKYI